MRQFSQEHGVVLSAAGGNGTASHPVADGEGAHKTIS